jgi:hypothetical protein
MQNLTNIICAEHHRDDDAVDRAEVPPATATPPPTQPYVHYSDVVVNPNNIAIILEGRIFIKFLLDGQNLLFGRYYLKDDTSTYVSYLR